MKTQIIEKLKAISRQKKYPDGTDYNSISLEGIPSLAKSFKVDNRKIEIIALEEGIVPERYARNMKTISPEDQANLLKSQLSIVGLGGLGGTVSEILARTGIGTLNLIDGDRFEASNLNRQFLCNYETMGKYKTESAVKRIQEINASITVRRYDEYLDDKNSETVICPSDVIVDCLYNIKSRFTLEND